MRVTLNGINRRGLANWKAREKWLGRQVRIWSGEWGLFWRPGAAGYVADPDQAGVYNFEDAWERAKHCGPEKKIVFITV